MSWRQGWLPLVLSILSATALVAFLSFLAIREGRSTITVPLPAGEAPSPKEFPSDFGRLSELVPLAGGVAPIVQGVVPDLHAPEFRDVAWVNEQNPDAFTIQVLAARDEEVVKRFLAGREDRSQFVYFIYPEAEGSWYVVTTGRYATAELAAGIAEEKDFGSLATQPFPRRMSAYQDAVKQHSSAPE